MLRVVSGRYGRLAPALEPISGEVDMLRGSAYQSCCETLAAALELNAARSRSNHEKKKYRNVNVTRYGISPDTFVD